MHRPPWATPGGDRVVKSYGLPTWNWEVPRLVGSAFPHPQNMTGQFVRSAPPEIATSRCPRPVGRSVAFGQLLFQMPTERRLQICGVAVPWGRAGRGSPGRSSHENAQDRGGRTILQGGRKVVPERLFTGLLKKRSHLGLDTPSSYKGEQPALSVFHAVPAPVPQTIQGVDKGGVLMQFTGKTKGLAVLLIKLRF